jgi:ketosteroid isomerase-like protein
VTSIESDNIRIVKTMAENGILGRWDIVRPYIADDLVIHIPPGLPYGGDYQGWDGYLRQFKELGAFYTDLKSSPAEFVSAGDKVLVLVTLSGRIARNGKPISIPLVNIWELKNGKVTTLTPYYYDTKSICDLAAL